MSVEGVEHTEVEVITPAQFRKGRKRALQELGCSYEELAEMARTGRYESVRHRLAWIAYQD